VYRNNFDLDFKKADIQYLNYETVRSGPFVSIYMSLFYRPVNSQNSCNRRCFSQTFSVSTFL